MPNFQETLERYQPGVNIEVSREDTGEILWHGHNVITNTVKYLFARLMANVIPGAVNPPYTLGQVGAGEPLYGVWGLALGRGDTSWTDPNTQPAEQPTQTALFQEVLRKPLAKILFVDANKNPLTSYALKVSFQTTVNATLDNIQNVPIREMGLIGGGTNNVADAPGGRPVPTVMSSSTTAPYFDPGDTTGPGGGPSMNTAVLINYKTLPALILPGGVNIIFSWVITF